MWTRLTDREASYARYILDGWEDQRPALIDRNVICFVGSDGRADFLDALKDEIAYDKSCGVRTIGKRLLTKLERDKLNARRFSLTGSRPVLGRLSSPEEDKR